MRASQSIKQLKKSNIARLATAFVCVNFGVMLNQDVLTGIEGLGGICHVSAISSYRGF